MNQGKLPVVLNQVAVDQVKVVLYQRKGILAVGLEKVEHKSVMAWQKKTYD